MAMTPRERNLAEIDLVALRHGLTRHDLLGRARTKKVSIARKQCYQILRDRGMSYPQIGAFFGRHYTTVLDSLPITRADRPSIYAGVTAGLI
jgi:chromosomal replication initiation ATPase DnaA